MTVVEPQLAERPATVRDAASFLGVSISLIYKLLDAGDLDGFRVGRARRIEWAELRRYKAEH